MSRNILVVDDDVSTGHILAKLLESEGFEVEACATPRAALDRLRVHHYDVLLTDQVMPQMMGSQLVLAARALQPDLRCLIMSEHHPSVDMSNDIGWIYKPLDVDTLLRTLAA